MAIERADLSGRRIFALQFRRWKRAMLESYFPDARFEYLPLYVSDREFLRDWRELIKATPRATLLVWGDNISETIRSFARENDVPVVHMEDGFIRSLVGSASKTLSFSLTLDSKTPFFDATRVSDLEVILSTYDFEADPALVTRARFGIERLLMSRLSKYNSPLRQAGEMERSQRQSRRVLVIGQVEDDASIRLGCDRTVSNNDLVKLAARENPNAEILYRPHPDVLNGVRKGLSDPADVAHLARIVDQPVSLADMLDDADHVYAITSLGGFEALMRGIPVTLLGCPFYSGWGLTDDRQPNARRVRTLTIEQVFAAAYLLYPLYFNPVDGASITFEQCLDLASEWRETGMPESRIRPVPVPSKPNWAIQGAYGLLGWRHLMTAPIARLISIAGADALDYRQNPILFFRELSDPRLRRLGRALYPFDDRRDGT